LRDDATKRVLAHRVTSGGTGDTDRIMKTNGRSPLRASPDAAAFHAELAIDRPTLVDLEVEGPLGRPGSLVKVAAQRWIMPGTPVTAGDGSTIELPGLAITPKVNIEAGKIRIAAKVEPMCGCPITPGGVWDAADYRVTASLWSENRRLSETELAFAHVPGGYEGEVSALRTGTVTLVLFAQNRATGTSGMTQRNISFDNGWLGRGVVGGETANRAEFSRLFRCIGSRGASTNEDRSRMYILRSLQTHS